MKYYLYRHIRLDKQEPFYIGIGTKTKYDIKYNKYSRSIEKRRNQIWNNIVNKTEYKIEILLESDNYDFIKKREEYFIKLYGRKNLRTGILANLTNGGEGEIGKVCSKELSDIRSKLMKDKWKNFNKEQRLKMSSNIPNTSVKVINTKTNIIYNSIKEAYNAENIKVSCRHFAAILSGKYKNNTNFKRFNNV